MRFGVSTRSMKLMPNSSKLMRSLGMRSLLGIRAVYPSSGERCSRLVGPTQNDRIRSKKGGRTIARRPDPAERVGRPSPDDRIRSERGGQSVLIRPLPRALEGACVLRDARKEALAVGGVGDLSGAGEEPLARGEDGGAGGGLIAVRGKRLRVHEPDE